jgi:hypothetical protein
MTIGTEVTLRRHPMRLVTAAVSIASLATLACRDTDTARDSAKHPVTFSTAVSLDSCERIDAQARAQLRVFAPGESLPPPHPGSWTATKPVDIEDLRLDVPLGVEVNPPNREHVHALWDFPGCRFACSLSVLAISDSGHAGLDHYLGQLHSVSDAEPGDETSDVPGPSRFLTIDHERAAYMDTPCGDCTSALIVTIHAGRIFNFNLTLDDQEGYQPGLMCRLARVVASARWTAVDHQ